MYIYIYTANSGITLGEPLSLSFLYIYRKRYIYIYISKQIGGSIPLFASHAELKFYNYFSIQSH